jgi:hypothetical protein
MSQLVTGSFDDDAQTLEVYVPDKATAIVSISGTITITPAFAHESTFISITDEALSASGTLLLEGPGVWRLVSSGTSGGTASCSIQAM